jgi:hypothetical protein
MVCVFLNNCIPDLIPVGRAIGLDQVGRGICTKIENSA